METKAFLADKRRTNATAPSSRAQLARLRRLLREQMDRVAQNQRTEAADITANFAFHAWMRDNLLANTPYDQLVRRSLASTGTIVSNPPVARYKRVKEPTTQVEDVGSFPRHCACGCAQCAIILRALDAG